VAEGVRVMKDEEEAEVGNEHFELEDMQDVADADEDMTGNFIPLVDCSALYKLICDGIRLCTQGCI
jgi:hypothetical protein